MDRIFEIYKQILSAHIKTKTTCPLFHEKSADFYELIFDIFHTISEKRQDIEIDMTWDEEVLKRQTYDNLEEVKSIIESMINANKNIGMDNLLRGLMDKLDFACGNARWFIEEEKEDIMSKLPDKMPIKTIKVPRNY